MKFLELYMAIIVFFLYNALEAQEWHVYSKNGCGTDGYITTIQKEDHFEVGYLEGHSGPPRFTKSFSCEDSIEALVMVDEFSQTNSVHNKSAFYLRTDSLIYKAISDRDSNYQVPINYISDTLTANDDFIIALRDTGQMILGSYVSNGTRLKLFNWPSKTVSDSVTLNGKLLSYFYDPFYEHMSMLQQLNSSSQIVKIDIENFSTIKTVNIPAKLANPAAIDASSNYNIIGKSPGGLSAFFYNKAGDSILANESFEFDSLSAITVAHDYNRFYLIGKAKDSKQAGLFDLSFEDLTLNEHANLFYVKHLESSRTTGFGIAFPFVLTFSKPDDSTIYYSESLYNIQIDSFSVSGMPGKVLATWGCYVGVEEREAELLSVKAYPNPSDDQLNIVLAHLAKGEKYLFEVLDIQGKKHFERWVKAEESFQINTASFPKGVLLLKLHGKQLTRTKKIVNK